MSVLGRPLQRLATSSSSYPRLQLLLGCWLVVLSDLLCQPTNAWISKPTPATAINRSHALSLSSSHKTTWKSSSCLLLARKDNDNDNDNNSSDGGGPFSFLFNPYQSKIPPELQKEIYAAEANTPAAKERGIRVATYAAMAFVGVVLAFFNAFITELRSTPVPPDVDPLAVAGFTWVESNFLLQFLFTNKLGGGLCLLLGAGSGLLAEAELDTKRINAEKIFGELERRRAQKLKKEKYAAGRNNNNSNNTKGKKRRSGKEMKRIQAFTELLAQETNEDTAATTTTTTTSAKTATSATNSGSKSAETERMLAENSEVKDATKEETPQDKQQEKDGILGKIKELYEKADSMAASQALLLNKELEDRGIVEKITDETGLKVVGREEAAKLKAKKRQEEGKTTESTK